MHYPGTISLAPSTFAALITDIVRSLKVHGFTAIVLIGDNGAAEGTQRLVADTLNAEWRGLPRVLYVPEFLDKRRAYSVLNEWKKASEVAEESEGLHDSIMPTLRLFAVDPTHVRWSQRVQIGKASIDGVSIQDFERTRELSNLVSRVLAEETAQAIRLALDVGSSK